MAVSSRHAQRMLTDYRDRGAASTAHCHRGRRPANATPEAVVADVVHLARTRYEGANHTHLSELLAEREGIHIGRTTLRRILLEAELSSPRRRRPPKHRVRRQWMPREGMLVQLDGSYHRWLADHSPPFTLLLAVDDATATQGLDQIVHPPGGHALHIGLLDDGQQGLLAAQPRFQQAGEVGCLPAAWECATPWCPPGYPRCGCDTRCGR